MAELPSGGGGGSGAGDGSSGESDRDKVNRLKREIDRQRRREREPSGIEAGEPISDVEKPGSPRVSPGPPDPVEGPGRDSTDGMGGRDPTGLLRDLQGSPTSGGSPMSGMDEQPPDRDPMQPGGVSGMGGGGAFGDRRFPSDRVTEPADGMGGGGLRPPTRSEATGAVRAARELADVESGMLTRQQEADVRQAERAINSSFRAFRSDPGRGRPDPNAEVAATSDVLDEFHATTRPATPEYGANVEGFDEVGSGPFDLPDYLGGDVQESAQERVGGFLGGPTDVVAQGAEETRRDVLDFLGGPGVRGGLATAAAAGVVAPEPVTSVGGAALLGGLAVTGVAADYARRQGEVNVPGSGGFLPGDESAPTGAGPVTETTVRLPGVDALGGEFSVPSDPSRSEIPVPTTPAGGTPAEIAVPELATSQLFQQGRQRQREERQRRREERSPFGGGASREELDEILQGPEEDVVIGEDVGGEFGGGGSDYYVDRDTDPRVVEPEESAGLLDGLEFDGSMIEEAGETLEFEAVDVAGAGSDPAGFLATGSVADTVLDANESALVGAFGATGQGSAVDTDVSVDVGLGQGQEFATPSVSPDFATATPSGYDFGMEFGTPTESYDFGMGSSSGGRRSFSFGLDFDFDGGDSETFDFGASVEERDFFATVADFGDVLGVSGGAGGSSSDTWDFGV